MESLCPQCHTHLDAAWKFCPACATQVPQAAHPSVPHEHEKAPVKESFTGLYFGLLFSPALLIVGAMLCLTGLGAFLGVPMIVAGILAPLIGPMMGFVSLRGKCPWCGAPVSSVKSKQSFDCEACHRRIAFRNEKFVAAA